MGPVPHPKGRDRLTDPTPTPPLKRRGYSVASNPTSLAPNPHPQPVSGRPVPRTGLGLPGAVQPETPAGEGGNTNETSPLFAAFTAYARKLEARSQAIPRVLGRNIETIAVVWACLLLFVSLPVVMSSPAPANGPLEALALALPYVLAAIAPLAGLRLAMRSFPHGMLTAAPAFHLFSYGRWKKLSVVEAQAHPLFGPAGFMASLLIGLLLNIVVRSFEFLAAVPALGQSAPLWGRTLFGLMAADLVLMNFFYMVCFALALRSVPWFPKVMLFAWGLDLFIQLLIAARVGATEGLPPMVAQPLQGLLFGNIQKVLISAVVWLPYLILSDRVNITYRQRMRSVQQA